MLAGRLTDGADVVFDCVGSSESLTQALAMVRPRGTGGASGHARTGLGRPGPAVAPRAQRWSAPTPTATSRPTRRGRDAPRSFDLAIDVVARAGLGSLVSAAYPLERYEEAIAHAGAAGRRGAVKVVFDLRNRKGRTR